MPKPDLETLIAHTIRNADTSYFREDYSKQARAVLAMLKKEGLAFAPATATEAMAKAGVDAFPAGRVKPEDLTAKIYAAMVAAAQR